MTIKRYDPCLIGMAENKAGMCIHPEGDYVEYADRLALVAAAYRDAAACCEDGDPDYICGGDMQAGRILARTPADAEAHLTALLRAEYELGVQSALQHIRTWMELEAEDRGEADAEYPLERQCAPILALLTQEGQ